PLAPPWGRSRTSPSATSARTRPSARASRTPRRCARSRAPAQPRSSSLRRASWARSGTWARPPWGSRWRSGSTGRGAASAWSPSATAPARASRRSSRWWQSRRRSARRGGSPAIRSQSGPTTAGRAGASRSRTNRGREEQVMRVGVLGIGKTPHKIQHDKSLRDLIVEAGRIAMDDAGVVADDVQAYYLGNAGCTGFCFENSVALMGADHLGLVPSPAVRVEAACGTGAWALHLGCVAILSGLYDTVMVMGAEKMNDLATVEGTSIIAQAA